MSINIQKSQNKKDFAMAANLMAYSEPWITLGMNEIECLKAFEGDFKEVYVIYVDENFAGFIILQTQGSFKGYIQTICVHEQYRGKGYGWKLLTFAEQIIHTYSPNIFICVSDFNKEAITAYGVNEESWILGLKGVSKRAVFVVDKEGNVAYSEVMATAGEMPDFSNPLYSLKIGV